MNIPRLFRRKRHQRYLARKALSICLIATLLVGLVPPPVVSSTVGRMAEVAGLERFPKLADAIETATVRTESLLPQPSLAQAATVADQNAPADTTSGGSYSSAEATMQALVTDHVVPAAQRSAASDYTDFSMKLNVTSSFAATPISGRVFRDFNSDGVISTGLVNDSGVANVTVTAYDQSGSSVGTAVTDANGAYTINPSADGPYRVEFSNLPAGYWPTTHGLQNGTTVQIVASAASAANVNLGVTHPEDYCQDNPTLCTNLLIGGDTNSTAPVQTLLQVDYEASSAPTTVVPYSSLGTKAQVGSTYGLAYNSNNSSLYVSAYLKRHAGLGPNGLGAIYEIGDATTASPDTPTLLVDLVAAGIDLGQATVPSNAARGLAAPTAPTHDATVYPLIAKVGLGDLDIDNESNVLWATNLYQQTLLRIPVDAPTSVTSTAIPGVDCQGGAHRPFGVKVYRGNVYVGVVCDGQSSNSQADLEAIVYAFDPNSSTFTNVFSTPLTYPKGFPYASGTCSTTGDRWNVWLDTLPAECAVSQYTGAKTLIHPQPLLADIEFDIDGSMILGLRDRLGDQGGNLNYGTNTGSTGLYSAISGGDILRVANNNGTFALESNGVVGGLSGGVGNGEGPDGGEFYVGDGRIELGGAVVHQETSVGGLALLPGRSEVAMTAFDPTDGGEALTGGVAILSNVDGSKTRGLLIHERVFNPSYFGKAAGLGDVEILCDEAPLEIGNRVWLDANHNGIQDADEEGLANVTVTLTDSAGNTHTTVTNSDGNYYFGSGNIAGGIQPNSPYTITIDVTQAPLADYGLAAADAVTAATTLPDGVDSDATQIGDRAVITLTTGSAGQNNHTYDFGFHPTALSLGNRVWFDTNNDGLDNDGAGGGLGTGVNGVTMHLLDNANTVIMTATTDANGYYRFDGLLDGETYTVVVSVVNFASGGRLNGYQNSAPTFATSVDANDNGIVNGTLGSGGDVRSDAITLVEGLLPENETTIGGGTHAPDGDRHDDLTVDFGFYKFTLGDRVWIDTNRDGLDGLEPGMAGIPVTLTTSSNVFVAATTTDSNGNYAFTNLISDTYIVQIAAPANYVSTSPDDSTTNTDLNDNGQGTSGGVISSLPIALTPGVNGGAITVNDASGHTRNQTIDFGIYLPTADLQVLKRVEPPTYTLGIATPVTFTVVITNYGPAAVANAPVTDTQPANVTFDSWTCAIGSAGSGSGANGCGAASGSGDLLTTVSLRAGASALFIVNATIRDTATGAVVNTAREALPPEITQATINRTDSTDVSVQPEQPFYSVGNRVWFDTNDDGATSGLGIAEAVPTVLMELVDLNTNMVIQTIQTGANGYYRFDNVPAGNYEIVVAASNFQVGGVLEGYRNSSFVITTTTNVTSGLPLVDFDNHDHGLNSFADTAVNGVHSVPFTLGPGLQPTGETAVGGGQDGPHGDANSNLTIDFGFNRQHTGNQLWYDTDNDGVYEPGDGEQPVPAGIVVVMHAVAAGIDLGPVLTTTTDLNGQYDFSAANNNDLPPGGGGTLLYVAIPAGQAVLDGYLPSTGVRHFGGGVDNENTGAINASGVITSGLFYPTAGSTANGAVIDDNLGETYQPTLDFGFVQERYTIGNRVWLDTNDNGIFDTTEVAVPAGTMLNLLNSDGDIITTTTTNASGYYSFTNLTAGVYEVAVSAANFVGQGAGYRNSTSTTAPSVNVADDNRDHGINVAQPGVDSIRSGLITLGPGLQPVGEGDGTHGPEGDANDNMTIDFGFYRLALGNLVWIDENNNGIVDTAADGDRGGLNGVTVRLYAADGVTEIPVGPDGAWGTADDALGGIQTANGGLYKFTGLISGTYVIEIELPDGYVSSTGAIPSATGPYEPPPDPDTNIDNDDNGYYETIASRRAHSFPVTIAPGDTGALDNTVVTAAAGSTVDNTVDFGVFHDLVLGNMVWDDLDNDGIWDSGVEPGIEGVLVNLYRDADNEGDVDDLDELTAITSTTTTTDGLYIFLNLPPGYYMVELDPSNFELGGPLEHYTSSTGRNGSTTGPYETAPDPDSSGVDNDDNGTVSGVLGSGGVIRSAVFNLEEGREPTGEDPDNELYRLDTNENLTIDFGLFRHASLGDYTWIDLDEDGVQDAGEPPLANVRVDLYTGDDTPVASTTTDTSGYYHFPNLLPGDYYVVFTPPTGYTITQQDGGGDDALDSDADPITGATISTTLVLDENDDSWDAGFISPLAIGNLVWYDLNDNGMVDDGESGIPGVAVELYQDSDGNGRYNVGDRLVADATTSASGFYSFTNLAPTTAPTETYLVVIPETNFAGGVLSGYPSSTGTVSLTNTLNSQDNGIDGALSADATSGFVASRVLTLTINSHAPLPTDDGDNPPVGSLLIGPFTGITDTLAYPGFTNWTIDFGFVPTVSLGNRLFYDANNDGRDNDGAGGADGSSAGIDGAIVELYRDTNGNGLYDAGDEFVRSTTTMNGGYYTFTALAVTTAPTNTYLVVITDSNFITGGPLAGYLSSTDIGATLTPNGDDDFDDNGETSGVLGQAGGLVASRAISLTIDGEPTGEDNSGNDPTDDNDSNQTIDFGFFRYDWGDLPAGYPTTLADDGARHFIDPLANPILGTLIDGEFDGQPSSGAGADDQIGLDDEDGVEIPLLEPNTTVNITVTYSNPITGTVYLNGWIDFNDDGVMGAGEQIVTDTTVAPGTGQIVILVAVPANAQPGDVYARFRISSDAGLGMTGEASDGEVEDYVALVPPVDLGDLPDRYGTRKSSDGARHPIVSGTRLDGAVDSDPDGMPSDGANGDDNDSDVIADGDDEDGVLWPPAIGPNSTVPITVFVVTTDTAYLNAWIDFNGDGDFDDELERIVMTDTAYLSGTHVLNVSTPAFITDTLYARFRITDNPGEASAPTGSAQSGEVEDYVLMSIGNTVWLDNGQGGGTANNGILDGAEQGIPGVTVELYRDGDTPGIDTPLGSTTTDGDGHYAFSGLQPGDYVVHIPATNFDDTSDPLYAHLSSSGAGTSNADADETVDENGIDDLAPMTNGISASVVTLAINSEPTDDGDGANGNQTIDFAFVARDRGDLPDGLTGSPTYPTLVANNGANHVISPDLYFGSGVDADEDGQPDSNAGLGSNAAGDDQADGNDDEDGIVFMDALMPNTTATISMTAHVTPGLTAYYGAFIDFNGDGSFDSSEIFTGTLVDGVNTLDVPVPGVVTDTIYSRFRIAAALAEVSQPDGDALSGEVEDYVLMSLGNQLWYDTDNSGTYDGSELPVPAGITLTLVTSGTNEVIATTTTDSNGQYRFTGLIPGDYQVIVVPENFGAGGLLQNYRGSTGQDSGDATDNNDNGDDPAAELVEANGVRSNPVTLTVGAAPTDDGNGAHSNLTVDFGFYQLTVGNVVWDDLDNDGQYAPGNGEQGIANVPVALLDANGALEATTTTDGSGVYTFTGLIEGTYVISVTPPAGYVSSDGQDTGATTDANDNGAPNGNFIVSAPFDLTPGSEPTVNNPTGSSANPTIDFGLWQPLSLGNLVWIDRNNDGMVNGVEAGVEGVTVTLSLSGTVVATTTTDATGHYTFTNLLPGDYTVNVIATNFAAGGPLANYVSSNDPATAADINGNADNDDNGIGATTDSATGVSSAAITLAYNDEPTNEVDDPPGGDDNTNYTVDFGFWQPAAIGDRVWYDDNRNGVQDGGETGVAGVTVELLDVNGAVLMTTTTNATGMYSFTNLLPVTYSVRFVPSSLPTGYVLTALHAPAATDNTDDSDADPATGETTQTQLDPGEYDPTWDAGIYQPPASLGDRVWYDTNADGVQDAGENGVEGVQVVLYDALTDTPVATDTTDISGTYGFTDLAPGDYYVVFTPPAGHEISPRDASGDDTIDSDVDPTTGETVQTTLTSGENDPTWDLGLYEPAGIGDRVWYDANRDGVQDGGELGVENVEVELLDANGAVVLTTTTSITGYYAFTNLMPGAYSIRFVLDTLPSGYVVSPQDQGDQTAGGAVDSDADPTTGETIQTTLAAGEFDPTWDMGIYQPAASLGDRVWHDLNGNGIQDPGEPGIPGVTVTLYNNSGIVTSTTTLTDGLYRFENLDPGAYYVQFTPPAGYAISPADQGGDDGVDSDVQPGGNTLPTILDPGENDPTWDMGLYQPAGLGDRVWYDDNRDGVQDGGELGVANVTVELLDANGQVISTTQTNASGNYSFTNLAPGAYQIRFGTNTLPTDYVLTVTDGAADDLDSDADPATGTTVLTTLDSGEYDPTWDAGIYLPPAGIGDRVWYDDNRNGVQDSGETGVANVTVELLDSNGTVISTTTTNAGGVYSFTNLTPGDYSLHFVLSTLPPATTVTTPDAGDDTDDSDGDPTTGGTVPTTLRAGEYDPTWDLGIYVPPAAIGDRVWLDTNRDGVQDSGEPGLPGVVVNLLDPNGAVIKTTTTDVSGLYTFTNLLPGDYAVEFVQPDGYTPSPQNVGDDATDSDADPITGRTVTTTLAPDERDPTWDAGFYPVVNLGNLVWHDANNNGIVDAGEEGIRNVAVQLFREGDDPLTATPLLTDTTDVSGIYAFDNLTPGRYFVYIPTPPVAYPWSSTPTDSADNGEDNDDNGSQSAIGVPVMSPVIELAINREPTTDGDSANGDLTVDFGFFAPASLGDLVWLDTDKDGVQDQGETGVPGTADEVGVPGVLVTLYGVNNTVVATTTTDTHGRYLFENLLPGDYVVEFALPAGYTVSPANQGGNDAFDSDANPTTLRTPVTNLTSGKHDPTLDMGLYLPTEPASIGDRVWYDTDRDGVQDSGEQGVPGVLVTLHRPDGAVVATTRTDEHGAYEFNSLPVGDYYVTFAPPTGYTISPQDAGADDGADSDVDPATGRTVTTTLDAGEHDPSWDLGLYLDGEPASMGDTVWFDGDGDGIQDDGETGVPGVLVTLYQADGTPLATTRTDADGHYAFTNLAPGDYYVAFDPPVGYVGTAADQGADDAVDSDADPFTGRTPVTTLTAGENDPTWDYGIFLVDVRTGNLVAPTAIGNRVWIDANQDGTQDPNEVNAPGVTVKLYTGDGELVATDITDASGLYGFGNLLPGDYYVEIVLPDGYSYSPASTTLGDDTDSNADPNTGRTSVVTLLAGSPDPTWDTGIYLIPTNLGDEEEPTETSIQIYLPVVNR